MFQNVKLDQELHASLFPDTLGDKEHIITNEIEIVTNKNEIVSVTNPKPKSITGI